NSDTANHVSPCGGTGYRFGHELSPVLAQPMPGVRCKKPQQMPGPLSCIGNFGQATITSTRCKFLMSFVLK
ncbi:hypothetical protein ACV35N_37825, partial [Pseudomonas aeruginosa]